MSALLLLDHDSHHSDVVLLTAILLLTATDHGMPFPVADLDF